ncbi:putative pectate lyase D [Lasiodiplodia hormozganensis]|uniref:Pectate lyase n=1 Tax=Lasiodiplodia hormozganensis TaxID=869390 RepID=A0AA39Z2D4_9PEZI|nr:putative pectate lyase D [Lasiodiplodia hormozganensis]
MKYSTTVSLAASLALVNARSLGFSRRQSALSIPASAGTETLSEPQYITGSFDGGLKTYGRGVSCSSGEGGEADAVFVLEDGATLSNAIIGADQIEGVYCLGACTVENVWWEAVCEDALSIKGNGNAKVSGGGAQGAKDKVIQHNGVGTVTIDGFQVSDFGKLYRSCGNCDEQGERHVVIQNVKASSGSQLAGINSNLGDTATISDTCATSVDTICAEYEGNNTGDEPSMVSEGPSDACKYTDVPAC